MKQRVLTAMGLIAFALTCLFSALPWPVLLLAAAFYVTGIREIARLLHGSTFVWVGAAIWLFLFILFQAGALPLSFTQVALGAVGLFALGILSTYLASHGRRWKSPLALVATGWVAGPIACLVALHHLHESGSVWRLATPVLLAMAPLWAGDTAAIFAGKWFGKRKLWPALSPKKTWEGATANLIACIAVAVPLAIWIGYTWPVGLACGAAAGILGQYGDLFESYVKRQAGFKDSGNLLPGHGGVLDRIDSLLFTAPAVALILILWPKG